jgi:hypothetical protein
MSLQDATVVAVLVAVSFTTSVISVVNVEQHGPVTLPGLTDPELWCNCSVRSFQSPRCGLVQMTSWSGRHTHSTALLLGVPVPPALQADRSTFVPL